MKKINLALQGGGALGAYTWGVLDRLLEEKRIEIEGVSGTSAGAINAAVFANGYEKAGREGAKEALEILWRGISNLGKKGPIQQTLIERMIYGWNLENTVSYNCLDKIARMYSPYEFNPLNVNPLRSFLEKILDFEMLKKLKKLKLFISTTNVRTGRPKVFTTEEVTLNVLLASACLPTMFQAVEIDGEYYWDGGYVGNPSLWPLIYGCESKDIVLVQINPIFRHKLPFKAHEITDRINEISFNASLVAELRAIHFVSKMINKKVLDGNAYKNLHIHMIQSSEAMQKLNASSKLNANWEFFQVLKEMGRNAADVWLEKNYKFIGNSTSIDLEKAFFSNIIEKGSL
jgi:NTE family protein